MRSRRVWLLLGCAGLLTACASQGLRTSDGAPTHAGEGSWEASPRALAQLAPMPTIPGFPPVTGLPPLPTMPTPSGGPVAALTARVVESKSTGDFHMSGGVGVDSSGSLVLSLAAIRHPDSGAPVSPLAAGLTINASMTGSLGMACSIGGVGTMGRAAVDLVFIDDTTGSMQGTVHGVSDSVQTFAQDIAARGIDARFAMYTFGDAFATKTLADRPFRVGRGDFAPPSFDTTARPYVPLTDLETFKTFLGEMKASSVLGVGGGDEPENPLGALQYAYRTASWRPGAARVFIAITDTVTHVPGDHSSITPPWTPPTPTELMDGLDGDAVVHVIARDKEMGLYYNPHGLADGTGGAYMTLPPDGRVDLGKLGLKEWLVDGFRGVCTGVSPGSIDVVVHGTIVGKRIYQGTLRFRLVVG